MCLAALNFVNLVTFGPCSRLCSVHQVVKFRGDGRLAGILRGPGQAVVKDTRNTTQLETSVVIYS